MEIQGPFDTSPVRPIKDRRAAPAQGAPAPGEAAGDRLEISEMGRLLAALTSTPEVRSELVDEVRQKIQSGAYNDPQKFLQALREFLAEL